VNTKRSCVQPRASRLKITANPRTPLPWRDVGPGHYRRHVGRWHAWHVACGMGHGACSGHWPTRGSWLAKLQYRESCNVFGCGSFMGKSTGPPAFLKPVILMCTCTNPPPPPDKVHVRYKCMYLKRSTPPARRSKTQNDRTPKKEGK